MNAAKHRDADRTRESLLEAGTRLFAEHGYDGVSIETLAKTAHANKAMIRYYFGGKRELYEAIVTGTLEPVCEQMEVLSRSPLPSKEKLQRFIQIFGAAQEKQPAFSAMVLREMLAGGRHLEKKFVPLVLRLLGVNTQTLRQGISEGQFRKVNPLLTHLSLVGSLLFFFATKAPRERIIAKTKLEGGAPSGSAYLEHIENLFLRGLTPEKKSKET